MTGNIPVGHMRLAIFAAVFVAATLIQATAQAQIDWKTTSPGGMTSIVGTPGTTVLAFSDPDDGDAPVTLPFTFNFYGTNYTSVRVGTNGFMTFGTAAATEFINAAIPGSNPPNGYVALFWYDLFVDNLGSPGQVLWQVQGTAPNRIWVLEYSNIDTYFSHYNSPGNPDQISGQIRLHETTNVIDLLYADTGQNWQHVSCTIGLEDPNGLAGWGGPNTGSTNSTVPTVNYSFGPCSTCAAGTFASAACSATADTVCTTCTTCDLGWFASAACSPTADTTCTQCDLSCATCDGPSSSNCTSCVALEYLSGGVCSSCTTCDPGWFASAACSATADTVCTQCDASCATCSGDTASDCTGCAAGKYLDGGVCKTCSSCADGTYQATACTATANTVCPACDASCATCSGDTASDCTGCAAGKYLDGGVCKTCSSCGAGTYQATACTATANTVCPACEASCVTCNGATASDCTGCAGGKYLNGGVCSTCSSCGAGTYQATACTATANTVCPACEASCATCSGGTASDCTSCAAGKYLNGGVCSTCLSCAAGTYQATACTATANAVCTACDASCATCNGPSATSCTSCGTGKYLDGGVCNTCSSCVADTYQAAACTATANTVCADCDVSCATCTGPSATHCTYCAAGRYKRDNQCVSCRTCAAGTYSSAPCSATADSVCSGCPAGTYASAPGATACTACGNCDDGDPCTTDACNPTLGCTHTLTNACELDASAVADAGETTDTTGFEPDMARDLRVALVPDASPAADAARAVDAVTVVVLDAAAAADAAAAEASVAVDVRATEAGDTRVASGSDARQPDSNLSPDAVRVDSGTTASAKASGCGCDLGGRRGSSGTAGLLLVVGVILATFRRRRTITRPTKR